MNLSEPPVRVGQVWADNDWRSAGRTVMVIAITDGKAICAVAWPGHKTRNRTQIKLRRFRENSTGYRLIADVPFAVNAE
jgi:hypothetical protein